MTESEFAEMTFVSKAITTTEVIVVDIDPDVVTHLLKSIFGEGDYSYDGWSTTTYTIKREVSHD